MTGQTLIMASYNDLQKLINEDYADMKLKAFLNRYDNVLVGLREVARFHGVCHQTVAAYIKDGLIEPEVRSDENDHQKFRLSYVLTLDFRELQKQLRAKNKGW
jgi:hypothetical protein